MSFPLFKRTLLLRPATLTHHLYLYLHINITAATFLPPKPPPPTPETAVPTAISILTNRRRKNRWITLYSMFPDGIPSAHISEITLHFRNKPRLALAFFTNILRRYRHQKPSLTAYATIVHVLARARKKSHVKLLIKDALGSHAGRSLDFFRELVASYKVCDSAPFVFDLLVDSVLDSNNFDHALEIARLVVSKGCGFVGVRTCNYLVCVASKRKGCFFAYDLYKELFVVDGGDGKGEGEGDERRPNVHTFNELMLSFFWGGVVDMVEEVWIEMAKCECRPNCFSYSILMGAYCEEGEIEKAESVWEELRLKELVRDLVAYNTMIGGYCKTGRVEKGEELYREMVFSGVEGSGVTYQHLVNGYCLVGDADNALLVYKDMRRNGYRPESDVVDVVVGVLCEKKPVVEAMEFFRDAMEGADFVVKERSYEVLIKGMCGEGMMEEALKLQAEMVGKGYRPNANVYGAFIDGYMKQGKTDVAERLRKEMTAI